MAFKKLTALLIHSKNQDRDQRCFKVQHKVRMIKDLGTYKKYLGI